jgi:hypothetical protein
MVCGAMSMSRPTKRVQQIGLYDVLLKVDQDDRFTTFLTRHRGKKGDSHQI